MARIVTFGELLLRLSCPGHLRFSQTDHFDVTIAGAEANVAVASVCFGHEARFVSALPRNGIADIALRKLASCQVDTGGVVRTGRRMGVYYLEPGALQRPAEIVYDREGSSLATAREEDFDWPRLFEGADWFHTSGINPALSPDCARLTASALRAAKELGVPVSFDLNYRRKLWSVAEARATLEPLLEHVTLLLAGRDQLGEVLGISAGGGEFEGAEDVARKTAAHYRIPRVLVPLRRSSDSTLEGRAGVFLDGDQCFRTRWMDFEMIEPLGGGDALAGGLISALLDKADGQSAADFAVATACVKHSIPGDFLQADRREIESFLRPTGHRGVRR